MTDADLIQQIESRDAEIARLREEVAGWHAQHATDSGTLRRTCAERDEARAELAALRARIAAAPVTSLRWIDGREWRSDDVPNGALADVSGKRIRLYVENEGESNG